MRVRAATSRLATEFQPTVRLTPDRQLRCFEGHSPPLTSACTAVESATFQGNPSALRLCSLREAPSSTDATTNNYSWLPNTTYVANAFRLLLRVVAYRLLDTATRYPATAGGLPHGGSLRRHRLRHRRNASLRCVTRSATARSRPEGKRRLRLHRPRAPEIRPHRPGIDHCLPRQRPSSQSARPQAQLIVS
jgi:hypothetical protein